MIASSYVGNTSKKKRKTNSNKINFDIMLNTVSSVSKSFFRFFSNLWIMSESLKFCFVCIKHSTFGPNQLTRVKKINGFRTPLIFVYKEEKLESSVIIAFLKFGLIPAVSVKCIIQSWTG